MSKILIILAGPPASGKSHFSDVLFKEFGKFPLLSPDLLQEMLAEKQGYKDKDERHEIYVKAFNLFYHFMAYHMYLKEDIIVADYPFSHKQKDNIEKIATFYQYKIITIRFSAEFDVLYERRKKRDISPTRHLVYMTDSYMPGDVLSTEERERILITKKEFKKKIADSKYDTFALGELLTIDTTILSDKLDCDISKVIAAIKKSMWQ